MKKIKNYGCIVSRYGVAVMLLWFGIFKFTPTEAEAIKSLVENSPVMSWLYTVGSVQQISNLIGIIEVTTALGMILYWANIKIALFSDSMAILTFVITLSFLFSTPGMFRVVDGVFVPAGGGGFIIKDLVLLGAALSAFYEDYSRLHKKRKL